MTPCPHCGTTAPLLETPSGLKCAGCAAVDIAVGMTKPVEVGQ